ncbi:unnamed protein product, partial [Pocillopora meandrina]
MNSKARAQYQDMFSMVNWKALNTVQKKQHTLSNCGGCQGHYYAIHNIFHRRETFKTRKLLKEVLIESGVKTQSKVKPTQKVIKTAVKHIYSKVNGHFEKIFKFFKRNASTKYSTVNLINHTELLPTNGENIILGEGSYGRCLLRQYTRFDIKVVEKQSLMQDTTEIMKEAHIMQAFPHKNIPTIIGMQLQKQPI